MSTVTYPFDYYNSSVNTATYLTSSALAWGERSVKNAKDAVVKIKLLTKRYFMVPAFYHHFIKKIYG